MTTRDIWLTLPRSQKEQHVKEALQQLLSIENGTHVISGKRGQGRLAVIKADLETFLLNTADWEQSTKSAQKR
ncbi:MAG: hypothetical protein EBU46_11695 [Nitrosomonadaceae bacterium]|nr:hypothetical protein [Nitrosomonadaceae bacterium]